MHRLLRLVGLWVGFTVAATGCDAPNNTVYILRNQVLTDGCTVPDGSGTDYRAAGQLDVTSPIPGGNFVNPGYFFAAAVQNSTVMNDNEPTAHQFSLRGADVELTSNGNAASDALIAALASRNLAKVTQRFSGNIPPDSTAGVGFFLIDSEQTQAMNDVLSDTPVQILANARIFGDFDGDELEADPFQYPITVCKGCAINFLPTCPADTTNSNTGGQCNVLQDGVLDCCSVAGSEICPPPAPTGN